MMAGAFLMRVNIFQIYLTSKHLLWDNVSLKYFGKAAGDIFLPTFFFTLIQNLSNS